MPENNNINEQENEKRHLTSAERQKLYQEKATQRRIEEYRKRRRAKILKIALVAGAVLLLIAAIVSIVLLNKHVWTPAHTYESANELYAAEEYLDAYSVYISLGDYKDAPALAETCITKNAQKLSGREDVIMGTSQSMPWFKIDENGAIFFDEDKYEGSSTLIIPDVFDNKLVMAIGDKAFFYADYLEEIILPPSVKRIESQAFFACSGLKEITLPDSVEFIAEKAFEDCEALLKITFSANLTEIAAMAFRNCNSLEQLILPEGFKTLGARSFASCEKIAALSLPSSLSSIGNNAFMGCKDIVTVTYNGNREALSALCSGEGNDIILKAKKLTCKQD